MTSDDQVECPLCMELLEVDDIGFYPCTCGYQICRFCWHRLKTDSNGLCPACRKPYSENPAHFEPLSEDEIIRIKKERRQKEVQKKQKLSENRRHLSDVRVVQKNLVFIVGLSQRLADMEVLKKNEYFGKFGKILKVVINPSPSYAGTQTPSASAYVTYSKADEALKAIQTVNNIQIDNRTLKASLGTTKYCSHFLKSTHCPKTDCMYLHDFGEDAASFTKEEMSQGKHLEYESKLIETILHIPRNQQNISNDPQSFLNNTNSNITNQASNNSNLQQQNESLSAITISGNASTSGNQNTDQSCLKIAQNRNSKNYYNHRLSGGCFVLIDNAAENIQSSNGNTSTSPSLSTNQDGVNEYDNNNEIKTEKSSSSSSFQQIGNILNDNSINKCDELGDVKDLLNNNNEKEILTNLEKENDSNYQNQNHKDTELINDNNFQLDKLINNETFNSNCNKKLQEEDLGFDPCGESIRALQDLMQNEKCSTNGNSMSNNYYNQQNHLQNINYLNIPANSLSNSNKSLINHIEFFQKHIQQNNNFGNLNLVPNTNINVNNDEQNKILLNKVNNMNQSFASLNVDELLLASNQFKSFVNDSYLLNKINTTINISNSNDLQQTSNLLKLNAFNKIVTNNTSANSLVVPPPGFNVSNNSVSNNNSNPSYLTPSSSVASSSSSSSSSVNNSASSTPALNNINIVTLQNHLKNISSFNSIPYNKESTNFLSTDKIESIQQSTLSDSTGTGITNGYVNENCLNNNNLNLADLNNFSNNNNTSNNQEFTKNLHKTLKSILPNANISIGNLNYNNINPLLLNPLNQKISDLNTNFSTNNNGNTNNGNMWPDDPAIVSLTDRSNNLSNGNLNIGVNNLQSQHYLNSSLSPNFLSGFAKNSTIQSNYFNNNNNNQNVVIEEQHNQYQQNNLNKIIDESMNLANFNKLSQNYFNLNSGSSKPTLQQQQQLQQLQQNSLNNPNNNMLLGFCQNNQYASLLSNNNNLLINSNNQEKFITNILNTQSASASSMSLQQQIFMQQLATNLSANKKMTSE